MFTTLVTQHKNETETETETENDWLTIKFPQ